MKKPFLHARGRGWGEGVVRIAGVPVVDPATVPWVPVTLKAGDVLIYGNNMPHKSEANTSDRCV